jgi:hypothetical protein
MTTNNQIEQCVEFVCALLHEHVSSGGDTLPGSVAAELYQRLRRELREWDNARNADPYDVALRELMAATVRHYDGEAR